MTNRTIPLTDDRGTLLTLDTEQPAEGSIVLTNGLTGAAWQRHFADGLWHCTRGGKPLTWEKLLVKRGLVLVYEAPRRTANTRTTSAVRV